MRIVPRASRLIKTALQRGRFSTAYYFKMRSSECTVTQKSNVILTLYEKNKLNEYLLDGECIREIGLPWEIRNPLHAIELINGNILFSHGFHTGDLDRAWISIEFLNL